MSYPAYGSFSQCTGDNARSKVAYTRWSTCPNATSYKDCGSREKSCGTASTLGLCPDYKGGHGSAAWTRSEGYGKGTGRSTKILR